MTIVVSRTTLVRKMLRTLSLLCASLTIFSNGLCDSSKPDFAPIYLTLSPLHREATHSTKLIEREVEVNWVNGSADYVELYNTDPKYGSEPVFQFNTLTYPDCFVTTNVSLGDPRFPGGWEKGAEDAPIPGDHCLDMWLLAYKDKELVFTDCFKIRPTWMQDNRLSLENSEITSLFIPGTHNSGSYRRAETRGQKDLSGRYIITQDQSVWQQLVYGVRYLDLRVGYYSQKKDGADAPEDDNSFWVNHDLIKVRKLLPLIEDLKQFLNKTKEEIIILDLHRFPLGFTGRPTRHEHLVKLLERELKEFALPYKKDYIPTVGSFWDQKKRIIISYGDNMVAKEHDWLWPPIRQLWGNKQSVDELYDFLEQCMFNDSLRTADRGPWAAMAQLTPGPLDLLFNPKGSLRNMAALVNRNLTGWCRERWWDRANIVATDYFLGSDIIGTAIATNVFKGSTGKHYTIN